MSTSYTEKTTTTTKNKTTKQTTTTLFTVVKNKHTLEYVSIYT